MKGHSRRFRRAPSALPPAMSISVCAARDYPSRAVTTAGLWPLTGPPKRMARYRNARNSPAALAYPSTGGNIRFGNQPRRRGLYIGALRSTQLFPV